MEYISKKNRYIPDSDWYKIRRYLSTADLYLCEILRATGFRVDDILESVNYNWAFADCGCVIIAEKKTGKIREYAANGWTVTLLRSFREAYGLDSKYTSSNWLYLVPSRRNYATHLHRTTIYRHFKTACKKAGLDDKGYTIHSLRKNFAVDLFKNCRSLLKVQSALNHEKIETTMIYLMDALEFMA